MQSTPARAPRHADAARTRAPGRPVAGGRRRAVFQAFHRLAIARRDALFVAMPEIAHHRFAVHDHLAQRVRVAGKHERVEQAVRIARGEQRRVVIEHEQVGAWRGLAVASLEHADVHAAGLRAAVQRVAPQRLADARARTGQRDVAVPGGQALAVLEPAQFLDRGHRDLRVRADAERAAGVEIFAQREQAVAEVRLGARTQADDRAGRGDALRLGRRQVRRMHQAPARVDRRVVQQPLDRPRIAQCEAILHLAELLGDVDVQRPVGQARVEHRAHGVRRNRAQRMQREADAQCGIFHFAQPLDQLQVGVDVVAEAALALRQRAPVEAAGHVQGRQQRHADAAFARGLDQRQRHRRRVGIRLAVGLVMQVMELAHLRVAGLEHLHVQLRGDRAQLVRPDAAGKRVHRLAPGPEAVFLRRSGRIRVGRGRAPFGQARHRTLERMRMQVRHGRQHVAAEQIRAVAPAARLDRAQAALRRAEAHVGAPAVRQPGVLGKIGFHRALRQARRSVCQRRAAAVQTRAQGAGCRGRAFAYTIPRVARAENFER